mgnify:CR=1 FL=1
MRPTTNFMMSCALAAMSHAAFAQHTELSKQFSACMDKSGGVTLNMRDCIADETKRQDVRLNRAYKEFMGQISPTRRKQLQDAQILWIKYRDANCTFYANPDGGTLALVESSRCGMTMTASRAAELEGMRP